MLRAPLDHFQSPAYKDHESLELENSEHLPDDQVDAEQCRADDQPNPRRNAQPPAVCTNVIALWTTIAMQSHLRRAS